VQARDGSAGRGRSAEAVETGGEIGPVHRGGVKLRQHVEVSAQDRCARCCVPAPSSRPAPRARLRRSRSRATAPAIAAAAGRWSGRSPRPSTAVRSSITLNLTARSRTWSRPPTSTRSTACTTNDAAAAVAHELGHVPYRSSPRRVRTATYCGSVGAVHVGCRSSRGCPRSPDESAPRGGHPARRADQPRPPGGNARAR